MASGGGGGGQSYQNQTSQQQIPQWVNDASIANYQQAVGAAQTLMGPYPGYTVAPVRNEAVNIANTGYNNFLSYGPNGPDTAGAYNAAMGTANALMGYTPQMTSPSSVSSTPASWSNVAAAPASWQSVSASPISWSNVTPGSVTAGQLKDQNLSPYMDPYIGAIIDPAMKRFDQQSQLANNRIGDTAAQTGSFGGSRQGVSEAVSGQEYALNAGMFANQMYSDAFRNAQAMSTADINRMFEAGKFNTTIDLEGQRLNQMTGLAGSQFNAAQNLQAQRYNQQTGADVSMFNSGNDLRAQMANQDTGLKGSMFNSDSALRAALANQSTGLQSQYYNQMAGLQGAGLNLNAATALGNLGTNATSNWLNATQVAMGGQDMLQQYNQQLLDADRAYYEGQRQQELTRLQIQQAALTNSPYPTTTSMYGTGWAAQPKGDTLSTILGAVAAAGGTAAKIYSSDRRLKTDIQKLGKDEETGLPVYSYRYKGDPKTYPKVVGPMAQDVEKKYPDQVAMVGGYRGVNANFLSGMMERAHG